MLEAKNIETKKKLNNTFFSFLPFLKKNNSQKIINAKNNTIRVTKKIKLDFDFLKFGIKANKINIDKDNTTIISGAGKKSDINARVNQIKKQIEDES